MNVSSPLREWASQSQPRTRLGEGYAANPELAAYPSPNFILN
jgi:hypothetical protein